MAKKDKNVIAEVAETVGEKVGDIVEDVVEAVTSAAGTVGEAVTSVVSRSSDEKDEEKAQAAPRSASDLPEYLHRRRIETGRVVSDKMDKTVVVLVNRNKPHPLYKKIMRRSVKFMAHDEIGAAMGDTVRIIESRPMSKHKRWRVVEIVQRAQ